MNDLGQPEQLSRVSGRRTPTTLFGRDEDLQAVRQRLGEVTWLTLVGPAGIGKTRLAEQLAQDVEGEYRDGAAFVDLVRLDNPARLDSYVAQALAVHNHSTEPPLVSLLDYLSRQNLLLVLDNCERVTDAVGTLCWHILRTAPGVRILATSRKPMKQEGEARFQVPPLSLPDPDAPADLAAAQYPAPQMLLARARDYAPSFALTEHNLAGLIHLAHRLAGIPLLYELAAPKLRMQHPDKIAANLDKLDSADLPIGRSDTRSLAAMVAATLTDCTPKHLALLARMWAFRGPFSLEEAEAVGTCDEVARHEVLPGLEELENLSVITADLSGPEPRFHLLETFREAGFQLATERDIVREVRHQHLMYYHAGVQQVVSWYYTANEMHGIQLVRHWLANIHSAIQFCKDEGPKALPLARAGLQIANGLASTLVWWYVGNLDIGRRMMAEMAEINPVSPELAANFAYQGFFATCQGLHDDAAELLAEARDVLAKSDQGDPAVAVVDAVIAGLYAGHRWLSGDRTAMAMLLRAAKRFDELGLDGPRFLMLNLAAYCGCQVDGDPKQVLEIAEWLLVDAKAHGSPGWNGAWGEAVCGYAHIRFGNRRRGADLVHTAMRQMYGYHDQWGPGLVMLMYAEANALDGDFDDALDLLAVATWLLRLSGMPIKRMPPMQARADHALHLIREARGATAAPTDLDGGRAEANAMVARIIDSPPPALAAGVPALNEAPISPADAEQQTPLSPREAQLDGGRAEANAMLARIIDSPPPALAAGVPALNEAPISPADAGRVSDTPSARVLVSAGPALGEASPGQVDAEQQTPLSPREAQVAELVAAGLSNPQIAEQLFISPRTVESHLKHVSDKIGARNRIEVAIWWSRR